MVLRKLNRNSRERKKRESFEIISLKVKVKFDDSMKVFNDDLGNVVNANSWKHFASKIKLMTKRNISSKLLQYGINIAL